MSGHHLSTAQRSLSNDTSAAAQLSRLTNGSMFNKLHGSTSLRGTTPAINNSLLNFSVEALASSAVDSTGQLKSDAANSLAALGENSKLDLSNFGLMAARLGNYSSYFGSGASAFDNFAQLNDLSARLSAARNQAHQSKDILNNQNGNDLHQSDDEDATSITSWDEEMINQDTEDEDDEILMNQNEKNKNEKTSKNKNKSGFNEEDHLQEEDDNIDIMDDLEK